MLNTWKEKMSRTQAMLAVVMLLLIGALVWILNMYPKAPSEQVRVGPVAVAPTPVVKEAEQPGLLKKFENRLAQLEVNSKPLVCDIPAPPPKRHPHVRRRPVIQRPIITRAEPPPPVVVAQLPRDGTECFANGHHGTVRVVDGKINCTWEEVVVAKPATVPVVAQLSREGMECNDGEHRGTYRVIEGQMACLLDAVTRRPVRTVESSRQYRQEPEVVYVDRGYAPQQQVQVAESSGSSWLPWAVGAGALWWGLTNNRNTSSPPPVAGLPAVITNPIGLGVVTNPAW